MTRRTDAPGAPVTMATVARRAGVSTQTVSNAFNAPELLRSETLVRVRKAVAELNYRPHRAARSLRTRSSKLIGYAIRASDGGGNVMDRFLHALSQSAAEAGYRVLLFPSPAGPAELEEYEELLREHSVDAFALTHTVRGDKRQTWLHRRGIPFVAFGRTWGSKGVGDWVDVDGAAGTGQAVDHLVQLGHRRIAYLGWPAGSPVGDDRLRGWKEAMKRHGLPVRGLRAQALGEVEQGAAAAGGLLDAGASAVVTASDTLAMGCYLALRDRGLSAGRDVSVVGFDDAPAAQLLSPGLTTLRQPMEDVGQMCMQLLLKRITDPSAPAERVLLAPHLVVRDSTAPVPLTA
ncbi:LacI family DNA-binding transcriptional regulator [Streptomyces purpurogeneiscleroticus]|uniref:LacI family DNA-binding transcriptional regulator n=1 Tax=Streptomyces purpurogeneiscleroticus TaxID=68259 RepID=UPI001CBF7A25|nr:LacI family DNA-binding transcriptional regulator [Streptomyces purpurogeneiscleroticus]MBZ4016076.1 transcriptional regulator [Streptomyces purpurogeneiscleroticus]